MARRCLLLVAVAGCGFSLQTGGDDSQIPDGRPMSIIDDTKDHFVGTATDTTIADWGAIEPDAFVQSGLHVRAFQNTFPAGATYEMAAAAAVTLFGEAYRQVPFHFDSSGVGRPRGVGMPYDQTFMLLYDGEIYLPAGAVDIEVDADDRCAVDIMLDGQTWTPSIVDAYDTQNPITRLDVPAAGWYPIRAAFTQTYGGSWFDIYFTPAGGARTLLENAHTRVRATHANGLVVDTFGFRAMVTDLGSTAVASVDHDFGFLPPPWDLSIPADEFALRYVGQLRIDEPGTYTFTAESSTSGGNGGDLWRIWIDGVAIAGPWTKAPVMEASVDLEVGWHDFGLDFGDDSGDARIRALMSGPQIPMGAIDPARLRPVVATGLTSTFSDLQDRTQIQDATSSGPTDTTIDIDVNGTAGAKVVSVDWGLGIEYSRMSDLSGARLDCSASGTPLPLGASAGYFYVANDTACAGSDLPLAWKYRLTDSVIGGIAGNVWNPLVAVTYRGGEHDPPFAREAVFTSSVRETPNAIGYGRVALDATLRGGNAILEVRTAVDEASIATAEWVPVAHGDVPNVEAGEVLQYRVTLLTGGWALVSVERVEIVYIVPE